MALFKEISPIIIANPALLDAQKIVLANELWKELHTHAMNHDGTNDANFLLFFGSKIPRYLSGCRCYEFWNTWTIINVPVYDVDKYFEWTVRLHNAVNTKLNKPEISIEEAKILYKKQ
jgi:hypothetical protein